MIIKPSLPKGMRDFLPQEVAKRQFIMQTIAQVFQKFGFSFSRMQIQLSFFIIKTALIIMSQ